MTRPTNDEGPTVLATVAPQESKRNESPDYHGAPYSGQALLADACRCLTAGGKRCMTCRRWQRHYGDVLQRRAAERGFCRAIEKALGVHHA